MKILFVHQNLATFVKKDLEILREKHEVREVVFWGKLAPLKILRYILWCDITFSWFGSINAFWAVLFSRIFRKKSIVVAGGFDVGQDNGLWAQPLKSWCPKYVFSRADKIITVSNYNNNETKVNVKVDTNKVVMIYHGFNGSKFKRREDCKKEKMVLTISRIADHQIKRKGIDLFVQAASLMTDIPFVIVGSWLDNSINDLKRLAPPNVIFTGGLSESELIDCASRAKVYVQASRHEAFGCSLAEAMLCECVPVVSKNAALPEVVGSAGLYLDRLSSDELAEKIREAFNHPELGIIARKRILEKFPLSKRRDALLKAVETLEAR